MLASNEPDPPLAGGLDDRQDGAVWDAHQHWHAVPIGRGFQKGSVGFDLARVQHGQVVGRAADRLQVRFDDGTEFVCPLTIQNDSMKFHGFPFAKERDVRTHILASAEAAKKAKGAA